MEQVVTEVALFINQNNIHPMSPDLSGIGILDEHPISIACWTRRTIDNERMYHSFAISKPWKKGEPRVTLTKKNQKLYEFNKQNDEDPDFQTPAAFELLGKQYWAALWVNDAENPEDIEFRLRLLTRRLRQS